MNAIDTGCCGVCLTPEGDRDLRAAGFSFTRLTNDQESERRELFTAARPLVCPGCHRAVGIDCTDLDRAQLHRLVALLVRCAARGDQKLWR